MGTITEALEEEKAICKRSQIQLRPGGRKRQKWREEKGRKERSRERKGRGQDPLGEGGVVWAARAPPWPHLSSFRTKLSRAELI